MAPVQPDDRVGVTRPDGVAGRLDEDCGVEHALTIDRRSVLNSPRGARADCGQADRSGDTAPAGAWTYVLRRFRHRDRVSAAPGGRQFQGSSCSSWVRRPIRAKVHGKKREHGRNSYDFGLEIPDLVRERHKRAIYCVQSVRAISIARYLGY